MDQMPNLPQNRCSLKDKHVWDAFISTCTHWVLAVQPDFLRGDEEGSDVPCECPTTPLRGDEEGSAVRCRSPATPDRCEKKQRVH